MGTGQKKSTAEAAAPSVEPESEPGLLDWAGQVGNDFVQSTLEVTTESTQGYMHSPILERLLGIEREEPDTDLDVEWDPSQPWHRDNLRKKIHYDYQGEDGQSLVGDDDLVNLMGTLSQERPEDVSPEDLAAWQSAQKDAAIRLGEMRGRTPEEAMEDYGNYRRLQEEQRERARELGLPEPEALDMSKHADHMGSIQQLRYGSYVGDSLGVDAVYGALLNPTGGLVGEGNEGYSADPRSVASFHGEAHDAFGYLRNYHDVGPGYMYASPDEAREHGATDPGSLGPYTGQASGFTLWNALLTEEGLADPNHPGDVNGQMEESLRELGHDPLLDPVRVGWNPTPGFPDQNPTMPNPIQEHIPAVVETVEEIIHAIGNFDPSDILA